jgi:hypothetical protein
VAVGSRGEAGEVLAEQPGQFRVGRNDANVALGPVLELPAFPRAVVIGPLAAGVWCRTAQVQLTPVLVVGRVLPLLAGAAVAVLPAGFLLSMATPLSAAGRIRVPRQLPRFSRRRPAPAGPVQGPHEAPPPCRRAPARR